MLVHLRRRSTRGEPETGRYGDDPEKGAQHRSLQA